MGQIQSHSQQNESILTHFINLSFFIIYFTLLAEPP